MEGTYRVIRPAKILGKMREVDDVITNEEFDKAHVSSAVIDAMVGERMIERAGQTPQDIGGKLDLLIAQNERLIELIEPLQAFLTGMKPVKAKTARRGRKKLAFKTSED